MAKTTGIGEMLRKNKGLKKPSIEVSVYKPHSGDSPISMDDTKYLKKDLQREKKSVLEFEEILEKWVPEDIAAMARKEVEQKLAESKLRIKDVRARIKLRS